MDISILLNTHFNILLNIGEYWFPYCPILPEHLADVGETSQSLTTLSPTPGGLRLVDRRDSG